jgi:ABC-type bacteriocin/lantibiotic exporter with double-glycine peptidase domain
MFHSIPLLWLLVRSHVAAQRTLLMCVALLTVASTVTGLIGPWMTKGIVDIYIPNRDIHMLTLSLTKAAAATVIAYALWALQQIIAAKATERLFMDVKIHMLGQLLEHSRNRFNGLSDADIALELNTTVKSAANMFREDIIAGIVEMLAIVSLLIAATVMHWQAGIFLLFAIMIYAVVLAVMAKPLRAMAAKNGRATTQQNTAFMDILAASRDIKVFNLASMMLVRYAIALGQLAKIQFNLVSFDAILRSCFGLLGVLLTLALTGFLGTLIIFKDPTMSIGLLLTLLTVSALLVTTVNKILLRLSRLAVVEPSLRYFIDLMKLHTSALSANVDVAIPDTATIEFVKVSYIWPNGTAALRDFSLRTEPGDKVAIVGASGSGKSLMLDLLMRLREPTQGQILFSGINIALINQALYYSAFGFVGQNSHVMRLSLRDFLQQGWPDQTDEDLWRILHVVELTAIVQNLPEQLDTLIGPNGWQFAAGDRQRLALARALIRDPDVLILDEFTNMLDAQTEAVLIRNVLEVSPKRTVICTTHSPAVAAFFNRKIIL